MKKLLLVVMLLSLLPALHAQLLYGTTASGGANNNGTICRYEAATNTLAAVYSFQGASGSRPNGSLVQASNGKLYGMTEFGGIKNEGVIFSYDAVNNTYTKLLDFEKEISGHYPYSGFVEAKDGKLYGIAGAGSPTGTGVIFSVDPATDVYTKLKVLVSSEGATQSGNLIQATDGKLYGLTKWGGASSVGVIFSYDIPTNTYTRLYSFNAPNGENPHGSLVQASNGKLYGMTYGGGASGFGVIFSYDPATGIYTKLRDFDGTIGSRPYGSLIQASNGKLYGMTSTGGANNLGVIFSYTIGTNAYAKLKDFDGTNGSQPWGSLVQATDGKLYGMTYAGGVYNLGVAFSYNISTKALTKLDDFNGTHHQGTSQNGANPTYTAFIDLQPYVRVNNVSMKEGNSGQQTMNFNVSLSNKPVKTVSVNYKTKSGTATAPSDFVAKSGVLSFAPGVKTKKVSITIKGDTQVEGDELFSVITSNPVNATIKDSTGDGTILNDDTADATAMKRGANSAVLSPALVVFPNPAASVVNVRLSGFNGKLLLQLTDMAGKVIQENKLQANWLSTIQQQMHVSRIGSGTYLLVATDEKGTKQYKQVTVAH